MNRFLLGCGIASSLWYVAMNVYVPMQDSGYDWMSQTVSELSAIGAPTRSLWVGLGWVYTFLLLAFGVGLWRTGLRPVGAILILQSAINPLWPPMHLRPVLAAGGGTTSDTLHIVFTVVWGLLSLAAIAFASLATGRGFRLYSLATVAVLLCFGFLTGQDAPRMQANLSTPWVGVWERINIGAFMLWVAILALSRLRKASL